MEIKKIYLDMDGVLADFDRGVTELCGIEPMNQSTATDKENDILWAEIRKIDNFYDKLEPVPGAIQMFNALTEKYDVEILTGIPKPKRGILTSAEDKTKWVRRLLSKDIKINIVYREEKKNYVTGPDCILIDDLDKNIREWNENGGTGILFTSASEVLDTLSGL